MKHLEYKEDWPESWKMSYPYDLIEVYDEKSRSTRGYRFHYNLRRDYALAAVRRYAQLGSRVLDVAAAQGNFTLALAEAGYRVTWNDLRADLADYVRLKHEHGEVTYAVGNCFDLQFPQTFDAILATEIIEHVAHPDQFISQLQELIRPGGYIIITTPNGAYFNNKLPRFSECSDPSIFEKVQFKPNSDGHIFLLHPDEIRQFAQNMGLEIVELQTFTSFVANGYLGLHRVIERVPESFVRRLDSALGRAGRLSQKLHTGMVVVLRRPEEAAHSINEL